MVNGIEVHPRMKLDVNALGTFYRMARGAGLAAGRLTHMLGVETQLGVTKLNFMRGQEIRRDFEDSTEKVGVRVKLTGAIEGTLSSSSSARTRSVSSKRCSRKRIPTRTSTPMSARLPSLTR